MRRVRAVIIEKNRILLIKRIKKDMTYWVIPGGAVENGETDNKALVRECKEELGLDVELGDLLLEMDSKKPETKGQKELFYLCKIIGGKIGTGQGPEFKINSSYVGRYKIEWRKIEDLRKIDLKPDNIRNLIYK